MGEKIYSNSSYEKVTPEIIQKVKVVTVGDISVGKSSLAMRFTKGIFEDQYKPTVGGKSEQSLYFGQLIMAGDVFYFKFGTQLGKRDLKVWYPCI